MPTIADIDALYASFCAAVPEEMRELARSLAFELRLTPAPGIPWSGVFKHRVTLQAPCLLFERTAGLEPWALERATLAHMLAVIEAFGTDRIADRQIAGTPELSRVLALARAARDEALLGIGGASAVQMAQDADRGTRDAIAKERDLLGSSEGVDFETYEAVSGGKQSVGLPASMVLARAAGFDPPQLEAVSSTLMGVWLGLQFLDDVVDWEDDVTHGGAWAVVLSRRSEPSVPPTTNPDALKQHVLSSGVLAKMLALSAQRFDSALAGAESLGAEGLAEWLRARSAESLAFCEHERKSPGYLRRLKQLSPWAAEVLA
jgi:hypothetical protein